MIPRMYLYPPGHFFHGLKCLQPFQLMQPLSTSPSAGLSARLLARYYSSQSRTLHRRYNNPVSTKTQTTSSAETPASQLSTRSDQQQQLHNSGCSIIDPLPQQKSESSPRPPTTVSCPTLSFPYKQVTFPSTKLKLANPNSARPTIAGNFPQAAGSKHHHKTSASSSAANRAGILAAHLSTSASSSQHRQSNMAPSYTTRQIGARHTLEHRVFIEKDGVPVSPFHDIPLYANPQQTILNMIVEVPRWTNAKMEVQWPL